MPCKLLSSVMYFVSSSLKKRLQRRSATIKDIRMIFEVVSFVSRKNIYTPSSEKFFCHSRGLSIIQLKNTFIKSVKKRLHWFTLSNFHFLQLYQSVPFFHPVFSTKVGISCALGSRVCLTSQKDPPPLVTGPSSDSSPYGYQGRRKQLVIEKILRLNKSSEK